MLLLASGSALRSDPSAAAAAHRGLGTNQQHQRDIKDYTLWESARIAKTLATWGETYPGLVEVTTAQEAYGLPAAGGREDCPFYEADGCPNYFFTIQDFVAHPPGSPSSDRLPEVFWSGCLHGNERVGPTSVMEASVLLLEAARCEALPSQPKPKSKPKPQSSKDLEEAGACREALRNRGVDDVHRKWLARLVATRRIVVAPTTNGTYAARSGAMACDDVP